jgi:hypothetical protein
MNQKLKNKLAEKYPFLRKLENGKESYDCFGIECGNGWYDLLDRTCSLIEWRIKNPEYDKEKFFLLKTWYNKTFWNWIFYPLGNFLFLRGVPRMYDINHPDAAKFQAKSQRYWKWSNVFEAYPRHVAPKSPLNFQVLQIKEKFAGLRFYYSAYYEHRKFFGLIKSYKQDEYIHGVISYAENLSYHICEACGSNQKVTINKTGWRKAYCSKCREELKRN